MWHPYGQVVCASPAAAYPLTQGAPASSKLDVQLLFITPHWDNTGRIYLLSRNSAPVLTGNNANILAWLPPPAPSGMPPFIKVAFGIRPSAYFLAAEVPNDSGIISAYVL